MTSHGDYSEDARDAAHRKAEAAAVFADNADAIVAALDELPEEHVLVALVGHDHEFAGTHHVPQDALIVRIPELEARGWAMVFTDGTDADTVRRRADEMATLARRRAEMITRIRTRRS